MTTDAHTSQPNEAATANLRPPARKGRAVVIGLWRSVRRFFFAQRTHREAVYLARVMWRRSYRDRAPNWQPLDDTAGVISQIDNMHAGSLAEIDRLRAALECMTPRYIELFEHCGLGPADDSIAVEMAREALGLPNVQGEPRPLEKP